MRKYEIATILHPDLETDIDNTLSKIERIIEAAQGKIVKKDNWGKRKLAYRINKQDWGIYVFYQVNLEPDKVAQIESNLRITEEVMRFLIVSLENIKRISSSTNIVSEKTEAKEDKQTKKEK
ncbi:MAG: 30S ribosomal protein S6 [bacterium]|nr:30S ribosomal protein S6 [bacterium]